ncbi:DUF4159 domain-containing protein [bacterium]|nr:MAG: DUF4159 domain-containing protein [bacterium]
MMLLFPTTSNAQSEEIKIARIKYRGGGDWYNDPSSLKNLIRFVDKQFPARISERYDDVEIGSPSLRKYPFAFMTGHGIIELNSVEIDNLREYLSNGGFLYIDDDYGLNDAVQNLAKRVFPNEKWIELPFTHPIYQSPYRFPNGVPKVHEHDNKAPQGFGLFFEGKLVMFYTYESNPSDGWADPEIHQTPAPLREKALQFGANLLIFALTQTH